MQRARAFIFAAEEDFGITPVEAQACGTPVIAFGRGGATETIRSVDQARPTGLFFPRQTPESIAEAVVAFDRQGERISPADCRDNAERFSVQVFRDAYSRFVEQCWDAFRGQTPRARIERRIGAA
jgi:glycosyltransferase involved in cell wall biosynthesis